MSFSACERRALSYEAGSPAVIDCIAEAIPYFLRLCGLTACVNSQQADHVDMSQRRLS